MIHPLSSLKTTVFNFFFLLIATAGWGQIAITSLPFAAATTTFDTYNPTSTANATSTIPAGWTYSGGGTNYLGRSTGTGTAGGYYGFGVNPDYSLGSLVSGSVASITYGVSYKNNSGSLINTLTISWDYEQWRFGGANTGGWNCSGTGVLMGNSALDAKDFAGILTGTTGTVATTPTSITLTGLNIAAGQTFGINWVTDNLTGFDNGVAIDNFNITASFVSPGPYSVGNGDWNTATTWSTNMVPTDTDNVTISAGNTVYTTSALTRTGTTAVNGSFQLNNGGYASGTAFSYEALGSGLIFNSGDLYGVGTGNAFWLTNNPPYNVTVNPYNNNTGAQTNVAIGAVAGTLSLSGQLDAANAVTVNGTLQMNSGGYVSSNTPFYGASSTLLYNNNYGVGNEWTGAATSASSGTPQNVTVQNSAVVTGSNAARGIAGNLNIISGNLTLNGDLNIGGSWTNAGTFSPNNKAVSFSAASGTQTITNTAGETFAYLIHNGAGLLQFSNNVTVNGSAGDVLQLLSGTIDLNGKTLTLSGSGGNVKLGVAQTLISSTSATLNISGSNGTKTVTGSALSIPVNVTTILNNGFDFGNNLTTIAGKLQMSNEGFVANNPPIYASGSTLEYYGVSNFGVTAEWTGAGGATIIQGSGIPYLVNLENSTVNMPNSDRGLSNKLTIGSGTVTSPSALNMNTASGDLYIGGIWVDNGIFNHNNRAVFFNGASGIQSISNASGTETFAYLINSKTGGSIQLFSDVNIVGNSDGALTLKGATNFDVQDKNLNINGTGKILVDGGVRNIVTTYNTSPGNLNFNGASGVASANSGTLVVDTKVKSYLNNTTNFGANLTTLNGALFVNSGGTASASPIYGSSASLTFNSTGINAAPYQVNKEWNGNIAGTTTYSFAAGVGIPPTVNLVNSIIQLFAGEVSAKDLNIDASSKLIQDPTTNFFDLKLFGNLTNNGSITGNNRTIIFQGNTT